MYEMVIQPLGLYVAIASILLMCAFRIWIALLYILFSSVLAVYFDLSMASTIEDKCLQLWQLLKLKAPVLRPKIIVRGFDDDQLLALCRSDAQKEALESTLDKFSNSKRGQRCSACRESVAESGGTFASEWDFDFDQKTQILSQLSVCRLSFIVFVSASTVPMCLTPGCGM